MKPSDVSVVIPARNEASTVAGAIRSALNAGAVEIIVADGGSSDETIDRANEAGATRIVRSTPGRGRQLNCGLQAVTGSLVLFLHADSRLGTQCLQQICDASGEVWGAFRQQIDAPGILYRLLESGNALRVKTRRMPFGDQAIFVDKKVLLEQGGIADIPLMEDVDLSRRLRRSSRPLLLDGPVIVSARRWQRRGVIRQTLRNWSIQAAYALGVRPEQLNKWYQS